MKNRMLTFLVVVLILVTQSCTPRSPNNETHLPDVNGIGQRTTSLPTLDPATPLPSPGAAQLRTLLADEPGISALIADVEAAEQAALQAAITELQAQQGASGSIPDSDSFVTLSSGATAITNSPSTRQSPGGEVSYVSFTRPRVNQQADGGLSAASMIGMITSMFTDIFSVPGALPTRSFTTTEKEGNATTDMSMEIGRSEDGSSHFGLGLKSDGTENGVSVKTDLSATVDGQRCPTAEGQVSFSIKARIGSETGGTGTTQDLTTFVRALVNDDAEISSSTFDIIQGTTQVKAGRQVYIESGETIKYGQDLSGGEESNWRINQKTDNVTQEDVNNLQPAGFKAALELGLSSLMSAKNAWQDGKCTKILATSPGTVKPGSTTAIPVSVISIFDGANAPSKLTAALTGAESLDPATLATTPGSISYKAPNENGKSATILLTATSKRGKAKLELSASTGGQSFTFAGENNGASFSGKICSLDKPFDMKVDATGYSWIQTFTPTSPTGGHMQGSYAFEGCTLSGEGPYTITMNANGTGTLNWTINSTVTCPELGTSHKTINHQLPLQPAPEGTCP